MTWITFFFCLSLSHIFLSLSSICCGFDTVSRFSTSIGRLMTLFYKTCQITSLVALSIGERCFSTAFLVCERHWPLSTMAHIKTGPHHQTARSTLSSWENKRGLDPCKRLINIGIAAPLAAPRCLPAMVLRNPWQDTQAVQKPLCGECICILLNLKAKLSIFKRCPGFSLNLFFFLKE